MGRRLEEFREWLTPRKRLGSGMGLFAFVIVVTAKYPESHLTWLIGPAAVLITGSFMRAPSKRR